MDWIKVAAVIALIVAPTFGLLGLARWNAKKYRAPKKEAHPKSK